jgi:ribosome maturation factor RimP
MPSVVYRTVCDINRNEVNGQTITEIRRMAEEVSSREGCLLYDVEFVGAGGGRILRVYIDKESEGGASIEDCTNVSRGLNLLLDVEDVIQGGNYHLEVSTPGLERVLKEPRHFTQALGKNILVKTFQPLAEFNEHLALELGKAKQIQGKLVSFAPPQAPDSGAVAGLKVQLATPNASDEDRKNEVFIPFETVTKAHVVFEFANPSEKKKSLKKGKSKK